MDPDFRSQTQLEETKGSPVETVHPRSAGSLVKTIRRYCAMAVLACAVPLFPSPAPAQETSQETSVCETERWLSRECAIKDPMDNMNLIREIKVQPWAKDFLRAAYKKNAHALISSASAGEFADQPYYHQIVIEAFQWAAQNDPDVIFVHAHFLFQINGGEEGVEETRRIIDVAARRLAEVAPVSAIYYASRFSWAPDAEEILINAVTQAPWAVFDFQDELKSCRYNSKMFFLATKLSPELALRNPEMVFKFGWAESELAEAAEKKCELAILNSEKFEKWDGYLPFIRAAVNACSEKNPKFVKDNLDRLPNSPWKTQVARKVYAAAKAGAKNR
jgi:hypothetical protein